MSPPTLRWDYPDFGLSLAKTRVGISISRFGGLERIQQGLWICLSGSNPCLPVLRQTTGYLRLHCSAEFFGLFVTRRFPSGMPAWEATRQQSPNPQHLPSMFGEAPTPARTLEIRVHYGFQFTNGRTSGGDDEIGHKTLAICSDLDDRYSGFGRMLLRRDTLDVNRSRQCRHLPFR
jgi:hypothetical protein